MWRNKGKRHAKDPRDGQRSNKRGTGEILRERKNVEADSAEIQHSLYFLKKYNNNNKKIEDKEDNNEISSTLLIYF